VDEKMGKTNAGGTGGGKLIRNSQVESKFRKGRKFNVKRSVFRQEPASLLVGLARGKGRGMSENRGKWSKKKSSERGGAPKGKIKPNLCQNPPKKDAKAWGPEKRSRRKRDSWVKQIHSPGIQEKKDLKEEIQGTRSSKERGGGRGRGTKKNPNRHQLERYKRSREKKELLSGGSTKGGNTNDHTRNVRGKKKVLRVQKGLSWKEAETYY